MRARARVRARARERKKEQSLFLSAMDIIPTRAGVVVVVVAVVVVTFSRWDNSKMLCAMKLKFCMVASHDYVL